MKMAIGSDHRGFEYKLLLTELLQGRDIEVTDCGCDSLDSADYPVAGLAVGELVGRGLVDAGVVICGSGIGISIAANKVKGVRASLCFTPDQARTTRQHNDSNVLALSGDGIDSDTAVQICTAWLDSEFEGGRHAGRVDLITAYENDHMKQE